MELLIPYYSALNKINCERHGSYYLQAIKAIGSTHPGLKKVLKLKDLSI